MDEYELDFEKEGDVSLHTSSLSASLASASESSSSTPSASSSFSSMDGSSSPPDSSSSSIETPKCGSSTTAINLLCLIVIVAASSDGLSALPLLQLVEAEFCRQYYDDNDFPESSDEMWCKEDEIQSKVAFLFAISDMTHAICEFLCAPPWGIAADRLGRKTALALSLVSGAIFYLLCITVLWFQPSLPIWTLWIASLAPLIGGGDAVLESVIMTLVSDLAPEDTRAVIFTWLQVANLTGHLFSPTFCSVMMNWVGPWPVLCVGFICLVFSATVAMFIPERLPAKNIDNYKGLKAHILHSISEWKESITILNAPLVLLLLANLLTQPIFLSTLEFIIQYVSKRYGLPIKDTGYIQTMYGGAQILHTLVILPIVSTLLTATAPWPFRVQNKHHRDLVLDKWSFYMAIPGLVMLGAAPNLAGFMLGLVVLSIGSGYVGFTKALMSLYVEAEHRSRMFTLVGMVDVVGALYSGPMMASFFSAGMKAGHGWIGLPYFALAGSTAVALVLLHFVALPRGAGRSGSDGVEYELVIESIDLRRNSI